jgi:hypothetical protein
MSINRRPKNAGRESSFASKWLIGFGLLAVVLLATCLWNSKSYPEATSPDVLKLIRALYTACSSRSEERLTRVEQALSTTESKGHLTEAELDAFTSIVDVARSGAWDEAAAQSYQFAQDQVR